MTDKVQKIKEYLVGMAGAACCDAKTKKVIKANILPFIDSMQEEPVSNDFEMALAEMIHNAQTSVVEPLVIAAQWKDELIKLAKSEEPVSEYLEVEVDRWYNHEAHKEFEDVLYADIEKCAKHFANWQKEQLWKPADGDDLPEYDREVIAILDYDFGHYKVAYAHRPNPNGWNGTNIDTGEKEHFEPEIYDKGGWNQPHILYWLDTILPYEENKIDKEIEL